jgi:steroid delta-isomerase-like uncharacterized protein
LTIDEMKELVRTMIEAVNEGDVEKAVSYTAPDCLLNGELFGREGDRMRTRMMASAFPDGKWGIDDMIAEGDKVVLRYTLRGTHKGELASLGLPPTGKEVTMRGITIYRIVDGMFVEAWEHYDRLGLLQQLGVIPQPA